MLKEQTKPQFPKPLTPIDKIYVDSGELTRLYRLWGESVVARVTAKVQEKGGGPIGIGFLNSDEFKLICEMAKGTKCGAMGFCIQYSTL